MINSSVGSHKSVLYHLSTEEISLVLLKVTLASITNLYEALLADFVPANFDIDTVFIIF